MKDDGKPQQEALGPGQLYPIAWFFYLVLAIGGVLWVGFREGTIPLGLFIDPATWWLDLAIGVAGGVALVGAWRLLGRLSTRARALEIELARLLGPLEPAEIVGLALLSGFAEELFFRGAMQGSWGWPIATLVFALIHTGPGPAYRAWTVFAGVAGLLLAGLMIWRGNLLAPVVAHVVVNGINLGRLESPGPESELPSSNTDGRC